jgi:hypothetical protein
VRLDINQVQPDAWGAFRLPRLVVEAVTAGGTVTRRVYAIDARSTVAYLELGEPPATIRIDPDLRLLVQVTVNP